MIRFDHCFKSGETVYTFSATKTLNGVTRNSSSMQVTLGAGSRHVLVVGRYRETGNTYDGYGYANQPMTGWTPYSGENGTISPSSFSSNPFFGIFTTSTNTNALNFTYATSSVDGFMLNKKINIGGLACNQTGAYYNGYVDLYQYDSCLINLHSRIGQNLVIYVQN